MSPWVECSPGPPGHFSPGWNFFFPAVCKRYVLETEAPRDYQTCYETSLWDFPLHTTLHGCRNCEIATHSSAIINSPPQFPRSQESALRLCTFTRLRERNRTSHNICSTCKTHNSSLNTHNSWSYVWCLTEFGMNRRFWATALSGDISSQASDWSEMSPGDVSVRGHFSLVHRQGGEEGKEERSPVQGQHIFYFLSDLIRSLAVNLCAAFLARSSLHTKRQIH